MTKGNVYHLPPRAPEPSDTATPDNGMVRIELGGEEHYRDPAAAAMLASELAWAASEAMLWPEDQ